MVYTKKIGRPPKHIQKEKASENQIENVVRTGGRVKKVKKVFDPSENNAPKKRVQTSEKNNLVSEMYVTTETGNNSLSSTSIRTYKKVQSKKLKEIQKNLPKLLQPIEDHYCSICSKHENKKTTTLILCRDCNLKAHENCIKINFTDKQTLLSKWRCDSCKTCSICYETIEIGPMITCSKCVKSYHYGCHVPRIIMKNILRHDWKCTRCVPQIQSKHFKPSILRSRASSTAVKGTVVEQNELIINNNNFQTNILDKNIVDIQSNNSNDFDFKTDIEILPEIDEDIQIKNCNRINIMKKSTKNFQEINVIPDVSLWSCEKLTNYVGKRFPNEAEILREQEIDGASLLLMTRTNVCKGLGLKLGPAIKLYNFIISLQTKKSDPYASWIY